MLETIQIQKRDPECVQVDRKILLDSRLTWKAKGILLYLLQKPAKDFDVSELIDLSTDKIHSIRSAFDELIETGYLERITNRRVNGTFDEYNYIIHEEPGIPQGKKKRYRTHWSRRYPENYDTIFVAIGRRDGFRCKLCGKDSQDLQIDHIYPISKGGTNDLNNLQLLCEGCNHNKSNNIDEVQQCQ